MPVAEIHGAAIHYEVLGDAGPWVALSPGGRRPMSGVESLGRRIADAGFRVLLHDRRNCGASDLLLEASAPEYSVWADDLHALLTRLDALPAFVGGGSSGCRLALIFALRYPQAVRGLLLWRVTGGHFAAQRLAHNYYGQYAAAALSGGMAAVCASEHFRERIAARPEHGARLMSMEPRRFIEAMDKWRDEFLRSADSPVIGATAEELASISAPACVIPGNDRTHPRAVGERLAQLLPAAELALLYEKDVDSDIVPPEEWSASEPEQARLFVSFLERHMADTQ